jgi:hypothetical protein
MGFAANSSDRMDLPIHIAPPTAPDGEPQAAALAHMVQRISEVGPISGAEALRALRTAFPDSPLTLRVAALNMLMRRHEGRQGYRPR